MMGHTKSTPVFEAYPCMLVLSLPWLSLMIVQGLQAPAGIPAGTAV